MDTTFIFNKPFPKGNIISLTTKLNISSRLLIVLFGLLINNGFSKTNTFLDNFDFKNDSSDLVLPIDSIGPDSLLNDEISKDAPEFPVKYIAKDSIDFDNTNQIVYLFGEAKVEYGNISLEADRIKVYIGKNEVHAFSKIDSTTGKIIQKVVFTDDGDSFEAPEMKYNFNSKKGRIIQATTQEGEMYLHSAIGKKMPNNDIFLKKGKLTTCDSEHPHFYFESQKLKIVPGKKIVAGPTNLIIREVRTPLWLPFGLFPNNTKRKSGILIPSYSRFNGYLGLEQLGYHWAINDYLHAEFLTSVFFSGRTLFSGELKYKKRYKYNGNFRFNYTKDVQGTPDLSNYKTVQDFSLKWNFNQDSKAHPKSTFKIGIDYRSPTFNQTQNLDQATIISTVQGQNTSQMSWSWTDKKWSLTTSADMNQNFTQNRITATLPSANLSIRPIKKGILTFGGSASTKNRVVTGDSTFFTNQTFDEFQNGAKANINMRVSKRVTLMKYLNITMPSFNWNSYLMTQEINKFQEASGLDQDTIRRYNYAYDLSMGNFGANTKIFGTFKFKNENMYVKGFRHQITPSVNFTYRPDFFIDAQNINQSIYDTVSQKTVEYSKYQGSIYSPSASKAASINFSLDQNLQSKIRDNKDSTGLGTKKVNIINAFRVSSSYNFLKDSMNWSDVGVSLNTAPVFLKNLNVSGNLSPYAINENGQTYDSLLWKAGEIGRLTSFTVQTSLSLNRNMLTSWIFGIKDKLQDDFGWTADITYSYRYNKPGLEATAYQQFGIRGKVQVTKKTQFNYNLPVNLETKKFATTGYFNIKRDLHCWEMSLNYYPFFENLNFSILIQPKAGMLRDVKLDRKFNERN